MLENFQQFIKGITVNFMDETLTFDQRIERIVAAYVDMLTRLPDLPMFILNEIRGNPSKIAAKLNIEIAPMRQHMFKQTLIASNKRRQDKPGTLPFHCQSHWAYGVPFRWQTDPATRHRRNG